MSEDIERLNRDNERLNRILFWLASAPVLAMFGSYLLAAIMVDETGKASPLMITGIALITVAWAVTIPFVLKMDRLARANHKILAKSITDAAAFND